MFFILQENSYHNYYRDNFEYTINNTIKFQDLDKSLVIPNKIIRFEGSKSKMLSPNFAPKY